MRNESLIMIESFFTLNSVVFVKNAVADIIKINIDTPAEKTSIDKACISPNRVIEGKIKTIA